MYTTNFVYKAPPAVLESLKKLFSVLQVEKSNFEHAAFITENRQLKETLIQFLQESNQYLNEIKCQIESLGGDAVVSKAEDNNNGILNIHDSKDVYDYCRTCENRILVAYREILNESVIVKELRNMVRYQLNGLLCAFLQLRMLRESFRKK
jgi:hypothetical protein